MPALAPYQNQQTPVEKRLDDLLQRMTVEEKIGQLFQMDVRDNPEKKLREQFVGSFANCQDLALTARLQRVARDETRLGIPLLMSFDAIHGHGFWPGATVFPTQLAMSQSWHPELVRDVARITAREMIATGAQQTFSPVFCLPRDLRWGRVDETFGEDPYLIGELGAAMVRGYQGESPADDDSVLACAKHFAAYGDTVGGRDGAEAEVSRRKLLSLFLPPFRRGIEAGCASVMIAYHAIDGEPCITNRWLLTQQLKEAWGFTGFAQTDYSNTDRLVDLRRTCVSLTEAFIRALTAGTDVFNCSPLILDLAPALVHGGIVPIALVDAACRRMLRTKFAFGLFDKESKCIPRRERVQTVVGCSAHREVARAAAQESLVLLHNRNNRLPLDPAQYPKIAVLGPNADDIVAQLGNWSFGMQQGDYDGGSDHPRENIVTVLDAVRAAVGHRCHVEFVRGCDALPDEPLVNRRQLEFSQIPKAAFVKVKSDIPAAVAAAERADVAIVVLGDVLPMVGEIRERASMDLPGDQRALVEALAATGTPLVAILLASKPHTIPWLPDRVDAILYTGNNGVEGGHAVADALFGAINPGGKLTLSWPRSVGQLPVYYNHMPGWHGNCYVDMTPEPMFPFGFGLSYTAFRYANLRVAQETLSAKDTLTVTIDIANTGRRAGCEIVQLYVHDCISSLTTPLKQLKAFARVELAAGETKTVTLTVPCAKLGLITSDLEYTVEPGDFTVMVGASSRDADLLTGHFTIAAAGDDPQEDNRCD